MKVLVNEKLSNHKYKTSEGYLICTDAILARTGKQDYLKGELFANCENTANERISIDRPYNEVFDTKTLSSFENKPVTFDHPDEDVNISNYKSYAVGYVRDVHQGKTENGEDVIMGNLVITDKDAIEAIENGDHTDLSCGYDCEIKDENGSYYQSNIRGNHVALCEEGRAGIARIVDSKVKDKFSNGDLKDFKIESLINIVKERQESTNSYRTDSQGNRYFIVVGGSFDADLKTGENTTLDVIGEDVNGKQKRLLSVYKASNWNEIIKKFNSWKNTIRDSKVKDEPDTGKIVDTIKEILDDMFEEYLTVRTASEVFERLKKKMPSLKLSQLEGAFDYFYATGQVRRIANRYFKDSKIKDTEDSKKMTIDKAIKLTKLVKSKDARTYKIDWSAVKKDFKEFLDRRSFPYELDSTGTNAIIKVNLKTMSMSSFKKMLSIGVPDEEAINMKTSIDNNSGNTKDLLLTLAYRIGDRVYKMSDDFCSYVKSRYKVGRAKATLTVEDWKPGCFSVEIDMS